jgi:uncharacterized protein YjbI with pentapeptide repeats
MTQQEQEPQSQREGPPAGWRYPARAKQRSRLRGWLAKVWRGTKDNAALVSLVGVLLTLFVTTLLTQLEAHQRAQEAESQARQQVQIAESQAEYSALQAYLDQMSQLMFERGLRGSEKDSEVRTLARARTRTVLAQLNSHRKGSVVQFLYEASLIDKEHPVVSLSDVRLRGADLSQLNELRGANLSGADLSGAILSVADLSEAALSRAEDSSRTNLSNAQLRGADLSGADLSDVDLSDADLSDAKLSNANLYEADLSDARLINADLSDAYGVTEEQLEAQATSLEGATMPNGQKYEDWLRDRENHGGG